MSIDRQKERLAELLREYRQSHNLTGRALARHIKLNPASLASYMDQTSYPTPETRSKIARAINMTPAELEADLNRFAIEPLLGVEQIIQDVRALNRQDFLAVAAVVFERLLSDAKSECTSSEQ